MARPTRRAVLKAAPALVVAPVAALAAEPESEVFRRFQAWQAADAAFKQPYLDKPAGQDRVDEQLEMDLLTAVYDAIDHLLAAPAVTVGEFSMKLIALADWNQDDEFCGPRAALVLAEAAKHARAEGVTGGRINA